MDENPNSPLHLPVNSQRLTLNAPHTAKNQNGSIQHTQCALYFNREIHVPRRIDDVDVMVLPQCVRCRRLDRNTTLSFQLHGIHSGAHVILSLYFVHLLDATGVKQNAFGQRGFTAVDMGRNSNISYFFQRSVFAKHRLAGEWLLDILEVMEQVN